LCCWHPIGSHGTDSADCFAEHSRFAADFAFRGASTASADSGSIDHQRVRLSLGTEEKNAALRRVAKIERALAEGASSPLWYELSEVLPPKTFQFCADCVGYVGNKSKAAAKSTWQDVCEIFEVEMQRLIDNKVRGASPEEGIMAESTRVRYRQTIQHFGTFLGDTNTPLDSINGSTIAKFKVDRHRQIVQLKQARGGSSIALDVAVLHRIFAFAIS
jgi:hypothetical protein